MFALVCGYLVFVVFVWMFAGCLFCLLLVWVWLVAVWLVIMFDIWLLRWFVVYGLLLVCSWGYCGFVVGCWVWLFAAGSFGLG